MIVWNTIANMRALDASVASFFKVLRDEIADQNYWKFRNFQDIDNLKSPNKWCQYAAYVQYSLYRIPRGKNRNRGPGNLTVGVELWREISDQENLWEHAKQPLIYVGFSPNNDFWSSDMALDCLGSPTWFTDGEIIAPTKDVPYLWTYKGAARRSR